MKDGVAVTVTIQVGEIKIAVDVWHLSNYSPDAVADIAVQAQRAFSSALADMREHGVVQFLAVDEDDEDEEELDDE